MPKRYFLDFEQPIAELENKIEELRFVQTESAVDISSEIEQLTQKSQQLTLLGLSMRRCEWWGVNVVL